MFTKILIALFLICCALPCAAAENSISDPKLLPERTVMNPINPVDANQHLERTSFQNASPYDPRIDIKSDVAMVYGIGADLPDKIKGYKDAGYRIHVMTGVSWGNYQDFISGKWDGINHEDCAQTQKDGEKMMHGPTVPYICPSIDFGKYLCDGVKRAIDAGAEAIHLEEPEFWVKTGYSEAFKREWQSYYNEPWIAPHTSPDAQYRASKLKYYLYRKALEQVFTFVRSYSKEIGRDVKCYVPTHSMINYASWKIVSPEASLVMIDGCDGYIGQVWTGTARTHNRYKGLATERTFETAFFEYGVLHNLVRSTGKTMWYLNDPVEDDPNHSWADYKRNWESTLVASLMWPDMWRFEVMPWPSRVFCGKFPKKDISERVEGEKVENEGIPSNYATELLTVINELNNMDQKEVGFESGTTQIGVLVSDTMMFQRGEPDPGDRCLSAFYGISLPLINRGMPAEPVQYENAEISGYLSPYKVLFLTYEGMKPPKPSLHEALVKWVKDGGVLVFVDDDSDPYNSVKEWWNTQPNMYKFPREHLFELLKINSEGVHKVGKGTVIYKKTSPALLTKEKTGDEVIEKLTKEACKAAGTKYVETNYLLLKRGPYIIGAGLNESNDPTKKEITGKFVDLFNSELAILDKVILEPGSRVFLLDRGKLDKSKPGVIASASKILEETITDGVLKFHSEGPAETTCATRVLLKNKPKSVKADEISVDWTWDEKSSTALITYPNSTEGHWIEVEL